MCHVWCIVLPESSWEYSRNEESWKSPELSHGLHDEQREQLVPGSHHAAPEIIIVDYILPLLSNRDFNSFSRKGLNSCSKGEKHARVLSQHLCVVLTHAQVLSQHLCVVLTHAQVLSQHLCVVLTHAQVLSQHLCVMLTHAQVLSQHLCVVVPTLTIKVWCTHVIMMLTLTWSQCDVLM